MLLAVGALLDFSSSFLTFSFSFFSFTLSLDLSLLLSLSRFFGLLDLSLDRLLSLSRLSREEGLGDGLLALRVGAILAILKPNPRLPPMAPLLLSRLALRLSMMLDRSWVVGMTGSGGRRSL